jgi:hypothetical protein
VVLGVLSALAEQVHHAGQEHHADEDAVDEDRRGQSDPDELEDQLGAQGEGAEHRHHDQRRRSDHLRGARQADEDGFSPIAEPPAFSAIGDPGVPAFALGAAFCSDVPA